MKRYKVTVGDDFEVEAFDFADEKVIEAASAAAVSWHSAKSRLVIAWGLLVAIGVALLITTLIGWKDGVYNEVSSVWNAAGPALGYILAKYFG